MRKFNLLTATALSAVMFFSVSCVENEESEGVKALRDAHTKMIEAQTNQTNKEARAQAMFDSIQAEIDMAELEIEQARADFQEAEYENDQALLELELEAAQMEQERIIAEAEAAMKEAEKDLEIATRELEAEIATSEVSNPALEEYMDKYRDAAVEVRDTRSEILDVQRDIADAHVSNDHDGRDSSMIVLALDQKERELTALEDWKTKYEEVADDPSTLSTNINDAQASLEEIGNQIKEKEKEILEAEDLRDEKHEAFWDVQSDYYDASSDSFEVHILTYELYDPFGYLYPITISGDYLEEIQDDPGHGDGDYYSIEYYDDEIENETDEDRIEELEEDRAVVVSYIEMKNDEYDGDVSAAVDALGVEYLEAENARDEAQDALDALNEELSQLEDEQTYTQDYIAALENDHDALVANLDGIKEEIETLKNEIKEIENNVESWEDYIDLLEDDLTTLQEDLEVHQARMDEYKQLIDQE
ncbi:MAG: hypothetical protein ACQEQ0_00570, partial [Bacteroidota bacterium]